MPHAGRAALVRLVSGPLTSASGSMPFLRPAPVRDGVEVRRRIGVLSSSPLLDHRLSGRENPRFAGRVFGVGEAVGMFLPYWWLGLVLGTVFWVAAYAMVRLGGWVLQRGNQLTTPV